MGKPSGDPLLGRHRYEDMLASWNAQGGPSKGALHTASKDVAPTSYATRLDWPNSTLLHGDIHASVAELKQNSAGDLVTTPGCASSTAPPRPPARSSRPTSRSSTPPAASAMAGGWA